MERRADVAVVGAGFGGLGAALALAERGAKVVLFEALNYPGGCASTFRRRGCQFEAGATLFSGFGEGHLFRRWIDDHGLDVPLERLDPVVTLRAGRRALRIPDERGRHIDAFVRMAPEREASIRAFFAEQGRAADALWSLFGDTSLLPPFGAGALARHVARVPRYLPLLRWINRPLSALLDAHRLADFEPLRIFLDAVCQITIQTSAAEAEAPFAMATMDYFFRGTRHVRGGIGVLAWALLRAFERCGGEVRLPDTVRGLERVGDRWRVHARKGSVLADTVVLNLLPQGAAGLLREHGPGARLQSLAKDVEGGWGAAMLYAVLDGNPDLPAGAHHYELIDDATAPFIEGNHVFCSLSAAEEKRAPGGGRTLTVSTHVPMGPRSDTASYIEGVQARMRATIEARAPELRRPLRFEMTASPRTFERFTGRPGGFVGGIPRRRGWHNYRHLWPAPIAPGVFLVGDSVFPGQSTLAAALGGVKLADFLRS